MTCEARFVTSGLDTSDMFYCGVGGKAGECGAVEGAGRSEG